MLHTYIRSPIPDAESSFTNKLLNMLVILYLAVGLLCFWIFFKSIHFFENI